MNNIFKQTIKPLVMILYAIVAVSLISWWGYTQFVKSNEPTESIENSPQSTNSQIEILEQQLVTNPDDVENMIRLASLYFQKVRESADTSYYKKIDDLANKVSSIDPSRAEPNALLAEVALGRHQFQEALVLADKTITLNPHKALYYGIKADALTELGRNDEAVEVLQKMVDLRPDYSSFSRIAYAREIYGEITGAKEALNRAIETGAIFSENTAWGYVELGKLFIRTDLDEAEKQFSKALDVVENYPPALEGLGKVAFARGDVVKAEQNFKEAFNILPIAQYAIDLGDIYINQNQKEKALQQYKLAQIAFDSSDTSGVNTDMERALFLAEHDLDINLAKKLAEKSYLVRPSIYGADALAWASYKNGNIVEALRYSKESLRLGEHDPLIVYHAGVIAKANNDLVRGDELIQKSFTLNPYFSMIYKK